MKFDITQLSTIFDELLTPPTDPEQGVFWLRAAKPDGLTITLSFSVYECRVGVLIHNNDTSISSIRMKNCSAIRVLDEKKKCLEILHAEDTKRYFLSLLADTVVEYEE